MLKARWINDPEAIERASLKPWQLWIAEDIGFRIPRSTIGNIPEEVRRLMKEMGVAEVVTKTVDMPYVEFDSADPSKNVILYAEKFSESEIEAPPDG